MALLIEFDGGPVVAEVVPPNGLFPEITARTPIVLSRSAFKILFVNEVVGWNNVRPATPDYFAEITALVTEAGGEVWEDRNWHLYPGLFFPYLRVQNMSAIQLHAIVDPFCKRLYEECGWQYSGDEQDSPAHLPAHRIAESLKLTGDDAHPGDSESIPSTTPRRTFTDRARSLVLKWLGEGAHSMFARHKPPRPLDSRTVPGKENDPKIR